MSARSERVKSIDFHSTEPWILCALYTGHLAIHNYETQALVKQVEVTPNTPVRCAKFIVRKQCIVAATDDNSLYVFNINTMEKLKQIECHSDFLRDIQVHATLPLVLTASDDAVLKLWNWDDNWSLLQTFEGHSHYVMQCCWSPKDAYAFASASLDKSIRVWQISVQTAKGSSLLTSNVPTAKANFLLNGHTSGVNSIQYAPANLNKPYLVSGSDDFTVRIWDYQTKQQIQVLEGHTKNISMAIFHPSLPILISGSEDGTFRIWHSATYRMEAVTNYLMDRIWCLGCSSSSNVVALGYDEGVVAIQIGSERPLASMANGKLLCARGNEIQSTNLKLLDLTTLRDGEPIQNLGVKDMGTCELFPQAIQHHPNGRYFVVWGDGEYIIYTSQVLRNKAFGTAEMLVWSACGNYYAIKEESDRIVVFKDFQESFNFRPSFPYDDMFGDGQCLCIKACEGFLCFYDWTQFFYIARIDLDNNVINTLVWSEDLCAVCTGDSCYILKFDEPMMLEGRDQKVQDGVDDCFSLVCEIRETIMTGVWVEGVFIFITKGCHLMSSVEGELSMMAHLSPSSYKILGVFGGEKIFVINKHLGLTSYTFSIPMFHFELKLLKNPVEAASQVDQLVAQIPEELHSKASKFLEKIGRQQGEPTKTALLQKAVHLTRDVEHQFELFLYLGMLKEACDAVRQIDAQRGISQVDTTRWKQVGDACFDTGDFESAVEAYTAANDLDSLFLIYHAAGARENLENLALKAMAEGKTNLGFHIFFILGDYTRCCDNLAALGRYPEAALFARSYCPDKVASSEELWRKNLFA